ncbi:transcriptional regulator [Nitriliruptor alkaliphilus]|uniref:transcriptional regulator n=1 Tax=Nitriliruptor alkaliphilus TaxID=427918 RepID=UPI00147006D2|nr:transcriptional regulator [Nitriliruptor alkaliphilus]
MSYTTEVGERLRRVRVEQGLSLQDVERRSDGQWKAAVVGSYERGDRNISATRLLELAAFYGVSAGDVLPGDAPPAARAGGGLVLDLVRLGALGDAWSGLRRYCETIQQQRGDYNRRVLSLRGEDLRAIAVIQEATVDELVAQLRAVGALTEGDSGTGEQP